MKPHTSTKKWFLLILVFYWINCSLEAEVCKSYKAINLTVLPEKGCQNFCCGNCELRSCCNNSKLRVNQGSCVDSILTLPTTLIAINPTSLTNDNSTTTESPSVTTSIKITKDCQSFKITQFGIVFTVPSFSCPNNSFCSGTCDNRYCSLNETIKLNQDECAYETCDSYINTDFKYVQTQVCLKRYCCGSCYNRYCCSDLSLKLTDQEKCLPFTSTRSPLEVTSSTKADDSKAGYQILIYSLSGAGIFLVCMIVFGIPIMVITYNYRQRIQNLGNQSNEIQIQQISSVNNVEFTTIDKPPSYKTAKKQTAKLDKNKSTDLPTYESVIK